MFPGEATGTFEESYKYSNLLHTKFQEHYLLFEKLGKLKLKHLL